MWSREVFKKIGDGCGGFIVVDEDIAFFTKLQWARILVKLEGKELPSSLEIVVVLASTICLAGSSKEAGKTEKWDSDLIPKCKGGRVREDDIFLKSLGGCNGGLERGRKGKARLGSMEAQSVFGP
ncbi:hypothetical protein CK203_078805 [Vitis vinifera]|uniref:DUF4283 domain-containing protein n=1 Tax=Vitis vinifera TaxID=29760 RepID=A0A438F7E7_VITVI|nr:hypothetical protein CK203_078805 [Vitis vinifera]